MNVDTVIAERLKQHMDNLAGWSEGKPCDRCFGTGMHLSGTRRAPCVVDVPRGRPECVKGPSLSCVQCDGSGIQPGTKGYLLPTEPDADVRAIIRRDLQTAIDELQRLRKQLGLPSLESSDGAILCDRCGVRPKTHSKEGDGSIWHYCDECDKSGISLRGESETDGG